MGAGRDVAADRELAVIGANAGRPVAALDGSAHDHCDAAGSRSTRARMRATMLTYARDGLGRVFVLTIAARRDGRRASVTTAIDGAIVRAGEGPAGVHVLRIDLLLSPRGCSEVIEYGGEQIDVRDADGVHLNVAGQAIAARVVADAEHGART